MPKNPYRTNAEQKHLETLRDEAKALRAARIITTDEGRSIMLLITRLIETLADGEPTAQAEKRHHE